MANVTSQDDATSSGEGLYLQNEEQSFVSNYDSGCQLEEKGSLP